MKIKFNGKPQRWWNFLKKLFFKLSKIKINNNKKIRTKFLSVKHHRSEIEKYS
jgi:hypothetical protein